MIAQAAVISEIPADLQALMRQRIGGVRGSVLVVARRVGERGRVDAIVGAGAPKVDADSRFEIGGASEAIAGLLLADAVRRGEVRLDEPIDERPTPGLQPPRRDGARITFAALATHRAGLPRLPLRESGQPFRGTDRGRLFGIVNGARLAESPANAPSNTDFALLGALLSDRAGTAYPQLAQQRVFVPLAMRDTLADTTQDNRLVPERAIDSTPVQPWDWGAFAPEGGVRSTAADLLRFSGEFFAGENGPLADDARLAAAPPASAGAPLGWTPGPGATLFASGWTYGATSFIGVSPSRHVAVVILTNVGLAFGNTTLDDLGTRLLAITEATPR